MANNFNTLGPNVTTVVQNSTLPERDSSFGILLTLNTVFFSTIIASGLIGNILVVSTLIRCRVMRTPCNFLIGNVSVADLCMCLIAAPLRIIESYYGWPFGKILCFAVFPLQEVFVCVSVVTHTIIALERHRVIIAPFKPKMPRSKVKLAIVLTWVGCYAACAVPHIAILKYERLTPQYSICFLSFPTVAVYRIVYEMYLVVFFILSPLVIQGTAYTRIICVLKKKDDIQIRSHRSSDANISRKETCRTAQKKHLVKMLVLCMALFQICYLPRGIIMLVMEFSPPEQDNLPFWYADAILLAIFYIKHIVNPVILWAMSKDFRGAFKAMCVCNAEEYTIDQESGNITTRKWKLTKTRTYRLTHSR